MRMASTLAALDEPPSRNPIGWGFAKLDQSIINWARILDQIASERGCSIWLEKTPAHIAYAEEIQKLLPQARFIHILRQPVASVASLVDAGRTYSSWRPYADIEYSLDFWNRNTELSARYAEDSRHLLFRYESLISQPDFVLTAIFDFIEIDPVPLEVLLGRRKATAESSILPSEPWKDRVYGTIKNIDKSDVILSKEDRAFVEGSALPIPTVAI